MATRKQTDLTVLTGIYRALFEHFGPQHWWPGDTPFEIAVGAILTQNTSWINVEQAIENLKNEGALNAKTLHAMPQEKLALLIRPAGYYHVKATRLKNFLVFLTNHYRGSMERMKKEDTRTIREHLLGVNGIGPETADSILLYALERPVFVIDAYTKRVLQRHRAVPEKTSYHEMQELFQKNLRADVTMFNEYHALLVMLGKHYCKPEPRCSGCPLERMQGSGRK